VTASINAASSAGLFRLDGRTAIVTGGTRGLGNAIVAAFLDAGANVVLTGRTTESAEAAARELGGNVLGIAAHMGQPDQVKNLVDVAVANFGGIDVVVNNAGISLGMDVGKITEAGLNKSLEVNLVGPVMLIQHALEYLRLSTSPSVVNILTAGIVRATRGLGVYQAAKAALEMMTRTMALELAPEGIRVNGISPGAFETDMVLNMDESSRQVLIDRCPMGRMGRPEEIVGPALFLAAASGSFVTGVTLLVDGGRSI
jgi:NAD(P)-dependent dehydrogenase (short-subunit alcohol dehydrogenase family)